jgi:hypothetical protein
MARIGEQYLQRVTRLLETDTRTAAAKRSERLAGSLFDHG